MGNRWRLARPEQRLPKHCLMTSKTTTKLIDGCQKWVRIKIIEIKERILVSWIKEKREYED